MHLYFINIIGRRVVWIVGSSIIRWAGVYAKSRPGGASLGLQRKNVLVRWFGQAGMTWNQFDNRIQGLLKTNPIPNYIIIQLGSNDLTGIDLKAKGEHLKSVELIHNIECSILRLKTLVPSVHLIWSDILPRCYWHGAKSPAKVEKSRKRVNGAVRALFLRNGEMVLRHPSIRVQELGLYRRDGVHLSDKGNAIYLNNVQGGLESFISGCIKVFP